MGDRVGVAVGVPTSCTASFTTVISLLVKPVKVVPPAKLRRKFRYVTTLTALVRRVVSVVYSVVGTVLPVKNTVVVMVTMIVCVWSRLLIQNRSISDCLLLICVEVCVTYTTSFAFTDMDEAAARATLFASLSLSVAVFKLLNVSSELNITATMSLDGAAVDGSGVGDVGAIVGAAVGV